jgi:hypothetical protein
MLLVCQIIIGPSFISLQLKLFQDGINLLLEILELKDALIKHRLDVGSFDDTNLAVLVTGA